MIQTCPSLSLKRHCLSSCVVHQGDIVVKQLDLADLASVDMFTRDYLATEKGPDLLILNAGVMACPQSYTTNGFEMQIGEVDTVFASRDLRAAAHASVSRTACWSSLTGSCNALTGTNHFGHFKLTNALLPSIKKLARTAFPLFWQAQNVPCVARCRCMKGFLHQST